MRLEISLREASGRLNILVRRREHGANDVCVRRSYTPVTDAEAAGRPTGISVPGRDVWDPQAPDQLGRAGAYRYAPDWPAIESAVEALRQVWGDLPVQINETR